MFKKQVLGRAHGVDVFEGEQNIPGIKEEVRGLQQVTKHKLGRT